MWNSATGPIPAKAGIGLRFPHHEAVIDQRPAVGWLEIHSENYFGGGKPLDCLERIRRDYPIAMHGVGLSLGSAEGLDEEHLDRVCRLAARIEAGLVSEHLSWSVVDHAYLPDLLPLPMTEEALNVVCENVDLFQSRLGRRILIENPSTYLRFRHSTIPEWEFLAAVARRTGCGLLCDVNNIYVSAWNHGWDAQLYLAALPPASVEEIHLAGHAVRPIGDRSIRIDDHGSAVSQAVWSLYRSALARYGQVPTLIERDNDIPPLEDLVAEAAIADRLIVAEERHVELA
jgi:uncharacterized protein (UPF0276 family)